VGAHRFGFSHQTYAEFLAARYIVDHYCPGHESSIPTKTLIR